MSDTLPPLPESDYLLALPDQPYDPGYVTMESGYTADQMRSYAAAALAAAVAEPGAIHQWRTIGCADWYDGHPDHGDGGGPYETRTLYAAPPQREPVAVAEPVAWSSGLVWTPRQSEQVVKVTRSKQEQYGYTVPLYAAPPRREREPLTDVAVLKLWRASDFRGSGGQADWFEEGIRAAEQAHGIKEQA